MNRYFSHRIVYHVRRLAHDSYDASAWEPTLRTRAKRLLRAKRSCYIHIRGNRRVYNLRFGLQLRIMRVSEKS